MQADDDESSDELVGLRRTRRSYLSGSGTVPRGIWRAGEEDDDDDDDELACLLASPDDGKVDIEDCNAAEGSLKPAIRCSPAPQSGKKRVRIDEAQNTCNVPQRKRQSQEPPAVALADDDMAFLDDLLGDADSAATLSLPGSSDPPTPATPTPPDSRAPPAPVAPAPTLHTAAHLDCMLDAQLSSDEEDQDTAPPPQIATTATAAAAPPAADAKKAKGSSASALLQKLREKKGGSSGANSSSSPDAEGSSSDGEGPDDADGAGFDLFSMQKGTGVGGGGAEAGIQHPAPAAPAADDDDFYAEAEAAEREEEDARLHNKGGPSGGSPAPLDFMQGGVFSFEALNAQSERQAAAAQPSGGDLWASLCRGAGDHQQAEGAPHPTPQQQPPQPPRQPQGAASSEPNPLKDEGNKHLQAGRFQEAVRCYGEALEAGAPDTHVLYSNRSCAHLSLGQHKRAFQDAVACVLERPAWFKGRLRKAMALRAVGQAIEAAAELRVAAECCDAAQDVASKDSVLAQAKKEVTPPADPSTGRFYEAFVKEATLGTRAYQDKDWSGSVRHYSKALSIDRSSVTVLSNRSAAFAHLNQFQQALTDASQCVVLNPRHPKGYIRKAAALKGLSLFTESTEALRSGVRAVEASGGDAAALKQQLAQQGG